MSARIYMGRGRPTGLTRKEREHSRFMRSFLLWARRYWPEAIRP